MSLNLTALGTYPVTRSILKCASNISYYIVYQP